MQHVKGERLYIEFNASQVRRRLKGHGFSVRNVESAESRRAVSIHAATGEHIARRAQLGTASESHAFLLAELEAVAVVKVVERQLVRRLGRCTKRLLSAGRSFLRITEPVQGGLGACTGSMTQLAAATI